GNPAEMLSMEHCRTALGRIYFAVGDVLVTNRRRALLELVEDSSPGVHDTVIACCDAPRYEQLGAQGYHANCADNFRAALAAIGITPVHVPAPLNLWMNIPVREDGCYDWTAPVASPGDRVVFRALADCVAVMSACPQDMTAVNGAVPRLTDLHCRVDAAPVD
ncbi:MAG: urea carboxylase-associated family protein, partial [Pseudomonadota bacterium]